MSASSSPCRSTGVRWLAGALRAEVRRFRRHDHADRRDLRHHHQPLPLLLAELAGGRGGGGRSQGRAAAREAASRRRASWSASAGRPWSAWRVSNLVAFFIILTTAATLHAHGHTDIQTVGAGGRGAEADRRQRCLRPVQPRHRRHRPARRAGAGGLGRLRRGRAVRLARSGWSTSRARRAGFYGVIAAAIAARHRLSTSRRSIRSRRWSGAR